MERAVGWFVLLATALLVFGFGYYLYHVADQRGWFKIKAQFHTYLQSSAGLNVGDPVYLMGFSVGRITKVHPMPPNDPLRRGVRVEFDVVDPYFRYIQTEGSFVKVDAAGFLNQRLIEITRGTNGYEKCLTQPITVFSNLADLQQDTTTQPGQWQLSQEIYDANSNLLFRAFTFLNASNLQQIAQLNLPVVRAYNNTEADEHYIVASWHQRDHSYEGFSPTDETAYLAPVETPPVSDELQAMIGQVQSALPAVIALTNQLTRVINNSAQVTSNLNDAIVAVRPLLTTQLTAVLNNSAQVTSNLNIAIVATHPVLTNANLLVAHLDTNITANLVSLADITSNLAVQVQSNSNMLSGVSKTILDYDDFIQGLKRHWLLRSAFKNENKTNSPPQAPSSSPRQQQKP
jgi:ABC-type transporter Mla subunit MlaD